MAKSGRIPVKIGALVRTARKVKTPPPPRPNPAVLLFMYKKLKRICSMDTGLMGVTLSLSVTMRGSLYFSDDGGKGEEDEAEGASVSEDIGVQESTLTDAVGQAAETGIEGDELGTLGARTGTLPAEVPTEEAKPVAGSNFDSQRGEISSKAEKPLIPSKSHTAPGSAEHATKWREKPASRHSISVSGAHSQSAWREMKLGCFTAFSVARDCE
jgi:cell division septation protein DedD